MGDVPILRLRPVGALTGRGRYRGAGTESYLEIGDGLVAANVRRDDDIVFGQCMLAQPRQPFAKCVLGTDADHDLAACVGAARGQISSGGVRQGRIDQDRGGSCAVAAAVRFDRDDRQRKAARRTLLDFDSRRPVMRTGARHKFLGPNGAEQFHSQHITFILVFWIIPLLDCRLPEALVPIGRQQE